jgi:hypothetical protein
VRRCAGLHVHLDTVVATARVPGRAGAIASSTSRRFAMTTAGITARTAAPCPCADDVGAGSCLCPLEPSRRGHDRSSDMAAQVTLTEPEVRAFSSLLVRVSERLANYEEQTHQDIRHAEELKAAANDLLGRLEQ